MALSLLRTSVFSACVTGSRPSLTNAFNAFGGTVGLGGVRYASKKAKGSSNNGRDSIGKRLGPKVMDGEYVEAGNILVRQRGTKMRPGYDVASGRDHTLYALKAGITCFTRAKPRYGKKRGQVVVSIAEPPEHRYPSIARKLRRLEFRRYRGPVLHAPL